ncbi:MAG: membrane protein insertion efficiency factor YidD [Saccharofermentanales bacterium]
MKANKENFKAGGTGHRGDERPSFAASGLLTLISFYQRYLSPAHPACCRFNPTCSAYAQEAVRIHGAVKGAGLSLWRIMRCQPLCKGGYDPVPDKKICGHSRDLPLENGGRLNR